MRNFGNIADVLLNERMGLNVIQSWPLRCICRHHSHQKLLKLRVNRSLVEEGFRIGMQTEKLLRRIREHPPVFAFLLASLHKWWLAEEQNE